MIKITYLRLLIISAFLMLAPLTYSQTWEEGTTSLNYSTGNIVGNVSTTGYDTVYFSYEGQVQRSTDGGDNWSYLNIPTSYLTNCIFTNYWTGLGQRNSTSQTDSVVLTTDAGSNWSTIYTGDVLFNFQFWNESTFIGISRGLEDTIVYSDNSGASWERILLPTDSMFGSDLEIAEVAASGDSTLWVLGATNQFVSNYLFVTHNLGQTWDTLAAPGSILRSPYPNLKPIAVFQDSMVLLSNLQDSLYRTMDDGATWDTLNHPSTSDAKHMANFKQVGSVIMASFAISYDDYHALARTDDFGSTWDYDTLANADTSGALSYSMLNETYGWAFEYGPVLHVLDQRSINTAVTYDFGANTIASLEADADSFQWFKIDSIVSGVYYWTPEANSNSSTFSPSSPGEYAALIFKLGLVDTSEHATVVCAGVSGGTANTLDLGPDSTYCGSATFDLSGLFDTYTWSDGDTNRIRTITQSGTYIIQVSDNSGCSVDTVDITIGDFPDFDLTDESACGPIDLDAGSYSSYEWSTGETTQTITVEDFVGTIRLEITNAAGCSTYDSIEVAAYTVPTVNFNDTTVCLGYELNPGIFEDYEWSTGSTDSILIPTTSGNYTFLGIDSNGCEATDTFDLVINSLPSVSLNDTSQCGGDSIVLIVAGDSGLYSWSTGSTDSFTIIKTPGSYSISVVVTDTNGCTSDAATADVVLAVPPTVDFNDTTVCYGYELNPGIFDSYDWNTGSSDSILIPSSSGQYIFNGIDSNGCTARDTVDLVINSLPSVSINDTIQCGGDSINVHLAGDSGMYSWSTGATDSFITIFTPGDYLVTVTVTDTNGCTSIADSAEVVLAELPTTTLVDDTLCYGTVLNPGVFDSYDWSTGESSSTIQVTSTARYGFTGIDSNGCSVTDSVDIYVNALPVISLDDTAQCGGTIDLSTTGYSAAGDYLWSTGSVDATITIDSFGAYEISVTVTDTNGCTSNPDTAMVNLYEVPTSQLVDTALCYGTMISPGVFDSYNWSTGETTSSIAVTSTARYYVTAVDSNGCSITDSADIEVYELPTATIEDTSQCGGTIDLTPAGDLGIYSWNTGSSDTTITIDSFASYIITVQVTDDNGCTSITDSAEVNLYEVPTIDLSDDTLCALTELDPGEFDTYDWNTGESTSTIEVTSTGYYGLIATDSNGCTVEDSAFYVVNQLPVTAITDTAQCGGSIDLIPVGYDGGYSWSTGSTDSEITISTAGSYSITLEVTDTNGCTSLPSTAQVELYTQPEVSFDDSIQCGGSITLDPGTFEIPAWSTLDSTATLTVTETGTYRFHGIDSNGCEARDTVDITIFRVPSISISDTAQCDGIIELTAVGDSGAYEWSTGDKDSFITISKYGSYEIWVNVTDTNGCVSANDTAEVDLFENPSISIEDSIQCGGTIEVFATGSKADYYWNGADTAASSYLVDQTGTHIVYVQAQDGNGCWSDVDSADITLYGKPSVTLTGQTQCGGTIDLDGGDFDEWLWSDGSTSRIITVSSSGKVQVIITDSNDCKDTASANYTIHPVPSIDIADSFACASLTLDAGIFDGYEWSTGGTAQTETFTDSGEYFITVTNDVNCSFTDTFNLDIHALPEFDILDTAICSVDTAFLMTNLTGSYEWSTGNTMDNEFFTTAGTKWLEVTDLNNCVFRDSFDITVNQTPTTEFEDFQLCEGSNRILDGGNYASFDWSTGATTRMASFNQEGTYSLTVTSADGCPKFTEFELSFYDEPNIDLGPDTAFCGGEFSLDLTSFENDLDFYSWSTGANDLDITVFTSQEVRFNWTDTNSCTGSDTIDVTLYAIPNAPQLTLVGKVIYSDVSPVEWFKDGVLISGADDSIVAQETALYKAVYTSPDGCVSDTSNVIDRVNSLDPVELGYLTAYPNPVKDQLKVDVSQLISPVIKLELINQLGESIPIDPVRMGNIYTLDFSHVSEGSYVLRILTEQGQVNRVILHY